MKFFYGYNNCFFLLFRIHFNIFQKKKIFNLKKISLFSNFLLEKLFLINFFSDKISLKLLKIKYFSKLKA